MACEVVTRLRAGARNMCAVCDAQSPSEGASKQSENVAHVVTGRAKSGRDFPLFPPARQDRRVGRGRGYCPAYQGPGSPARQGHYRLVGKLRAIQSSWADHPAWWGEFGAAGSGFVLRSWTYPCEHLAKLPG